LSSFTVLCVKIIGGIAGLTSVLAVAGCGGAAEPSSRPQATAEPTPAAKTLTVTIEDTTPLDVLFNQDDRRCTVRNFAQAFSGELAPKMRVDVRDADNTLVASRRLPFAGGSFIAGTGCRWPVRLTVPSSTFYTVEVTAGKPSVMQSETLDAAREDSVTVSF
jgi:hypothetical protein